MLNEIVKKEFSSWIAKNIKFIWKAIDSQKELWLSIDEIIFELNGEGSDSTWFFNGVEYTIEVEVKLVDWESDARSYVLYLSNGDTQFESPFPIKRG